MPHTRRTALKQAPTSSSQVPQSSAASSRLPPPSSGCERVYRLSAGIRTRRVPSNGCQDRIQWRCRGAGLSGGAIMLRNGAWKLIFGMAAAGVLPLAIGCRGSKPPPIATPAVQPTPTATSAVSSPILPADSEVSVEATPAPPVSESDTAPDPTTATSSSDAHEPTATAVAPPPPVSKERIVLLAPGNPIIIELRLTIDGRPHTEALQRLVEEVLKLADTDGDGRT